MPVKKDVSEETMEQMPPPYSSSLTHPQAAAGMMMEKGSDAKVEIVVSKIAQEANNQKRKKKRGGILEELGDVYGVGKYCPMSCEVIKAKPAAWVFALGYIALHVVLLVKVREPHVVSPTGRGLLSFVAGVHVACMAAAFLGICCRKQRLMVPFIFVQAKETGLLTLALVIGFCVPFLFCLWSIVSGAGDPFEMITKEGVELYFTCLTICVVSHIVLALFVRAAHNLGSSK